MRNGTNVARRGAAVSLHDVLEADIHAAERIDDKID
jgi:hypothetical protein